jgi:aminomethyltransferase
MPMLNLSYPDVIPGPPRPSAIIRPGGFSLPAGTERYTVSGGGALLVEVEAGDRVTIANAEGGQACELVALDKDGRSDATILGAVTNSNAAGLKALLLSGDASLKQFRTKVERRGINLAGAQAVRFFDAATPAGTSETFTIQRNGTLIVAAPGGPMSLETQDTVTPLTLRIDRARVRSAARFELPDPLADPVLDQRVKSATAEAYFVKAGDYIQIIDVDGRQCTDFQCFSARKLDRGKDHPLDVTTTRTLMGASYPMPGLHSRYFDQDMEPLVEVVQDTCGRHDAFALACAAKYYDDIGYPGHPNCSTNFNTALADKGVNARAGWMAVNFFFNTSIDASGLVVSDEPWSRPGDYVLLRALTSSAFPRRARTTPRRPMAGTSPTSMFGPIAAPKNSPER